MGKTLVIGVGNLLQGDEGVGIHVIRRMSSLPLPPGIDLLDGGTGGYELLNQAAGYDRVIIVDCMQADAPPGSVVRARIGELGLLWPESWSAHEGGMREFLFGLQSLTPAPEITIVGVVPEELRELRIGLSPAVDSKLDSIARLVVTVAS